MKKRPWAFGFALCLACLGLMAGRALLEGRSALAGGDSAMKAGDTEAAVRLWRQAARWYLPGAQHMPEAYERMEAIAKSAETKGDHETATLAWTGIRSSALATTHLSQPFAGKLDRANAHLADLMALRESSTPSAQLSHEEFRTYHLQILERNERPSVFWSLLSILALALWVGSGFAFALLAVDSKDKLVPKAAAYSGLGILLGLVLWMSSLSLA